MSTDPHQQQQQRTSQESATRTPPASPTTASASEPHPVREDPPPAPATSAAATTSPPPQPVATYRKPVPPVPIAMPSPAHLALGDAPHQSPAPSAPQTPSILRMPSPKPTPQHEYANPVAGPSSSAAVLGKQRQRTSPHASSEEDNVVPTPRSEHARVRPLSTGSHGEAIGTGNGDGSGNGNGNGAGNGNGYGHGVATPTTSIRRPTRAASAGRPGMDRHSRSITLTEPPMFAGGNGFAQEGLTSRPSVLDHVVPNVPVAPAPGALNGQRRRQSLALSGTITVGGERTVEERLQPTLEAAQAERDKAALKAKAHAWALNCAIGAQVVLGALTTGVAAATTGRQTSIATSVLGGMSTLAASYLAKARGSGEPEMSAIRVRDLEGFIRDCQAFVLDKGYVVGAEYDARIERYRRRFEEIMGNGSGGVGDQMHGQGQAQAQGMREKTTLPV
ncbi:hypothetical protein OH77DRAFT_1422574 [Trametes cingulata]|nr:hypothetical protein OH77DRAFT_1422574 [Trametes cingulata]